MAAVVQEPKLKRMASVENATVRPAVTVDAAEKEMGSRLERELERRVEQSIRTNSLAERKRLLRVGFEEPDVNGLRELREGLLAAAKYDDKPAFDRVAYELINSDPELTSGLTASEIQGGIEYLWNGFPPGGEKPSWNKFEAKPWEVIGSDLKKGVIPVGWKDWLPGRKEKSTTERAIERVEKSLPWYLRLPFRMIRKRLGKSLEKFLEDKKKPDAGKETEVSEKKDLKKMTEELNAAAKAEALEQLTSIRELRGEQEKLWTALKKDMTDKAKLEAYEKAKKQYDEVVEKYVNTTEPILRATDRALGKGDGVNVTLSNIGNVGGGVPGGQQIVHNGVPGTFIPSTSAATAAPGVRMGADGQREFREGSAEMKAFIQQEVQRQLAALNAQRAQTEGNPNIRHIREGMEMIPKGRWLRTALIAGGVVATAAALTSPVTMPFILPIIPKLMALGASGPVAMAGAAAMTGAAIFAPVGALRGAVRISKADAALRRKYGENIEVKGKVLRGIWETGKAATLGGVIGALLGYPFEKGSGADHLKSMWDDPRGWLSWMKAKISGLFPSSPTGPTLPTSPTSPLIKPPMPTVPDITCSYGGCKTLINASLGTSNMAIASMPGAGPLAAVLGLAGAGAAIAVGATSRDSELIRPQPSETESARKNLMTGETWKEARLSDEKKAQLIGLARQVAPGKDQMKEVLKVKDSKFDSVLLMDEISRLPWSPADKKEAMAPLKKILGMA